MSSQNDPKNEDSRRGFLAGGSRVAMLAGLLGGYGAFGAIAARFLYPAKPQDKSWMYVVNADEIRQGESLIYRGPSGETINVARQRDEGSADDFIALSSTCPHLGCQVHWEAQNDRFYCPCHNGVFDPSGKGVSGPPGDAGQSLPSYPLKLDGKLLFIELPVGEAVASNAEGEVIDRVEGIHAAGHDPCLAPRPPQLRECRDERDA